MKTALLLFVMLGGTLIHAQQTQPPGVPPQVRQRLVPPQPPQTSAENVLPNNYLIALVIAEKDVASEVNIVTNSRTFVINSGDPLTFQGNLAVNDNGTYQVSYALGWEVPVPTGNGNIQYRNSSVQGSVVLKDDTELIIYKNGGRTIKLAVKKLDSINQ